MVERCTMEVKAARSIPIAYGHERPITASHEGRKGRRSGRESQRNAETCVQTPARPSSSLFSSYGVPVASGAATWYSATLVMVV